MFDKLNSWFDSKLQQGADNLNQHNTMQLAAAFLLIEVSRADFDIAQDEKQVMKDVLATQFSLSDVQAEKILEYALEEHEGYTSSHPFIQLINEEMDNQAKLEILKGLWEVAYADDSLDKYEEYQIRKIADLLYLSHADFVRLKHQVLEKKSL